MSKEKPTTTKERKKKAVKELVVRSERKLYNENEK